MSIGSIPFAFAFLLSATLVALFCRLAPWFGLVDAPTARKRHQGRVPVCGGIAMFVALLAATAVRERFPSVVPQASTLGSSSWPLIGVLGVLVAIGIADDRWELGAAVKLALQLAVAGMLLAVAAPAPHGGMLDLPGLMPAGGWLAVPVTLFFVVGIINAFNMIDGLDGLAGGMAAVALAGLALAGTLSGHARLVDDSLLLPSVALGFLVFNLRRPGLPRALAFMGDAGSMMLGCAVAAMVVELSTKPIADRTGAAMFPALLWLVAIPLIDTLSLMVRRPLAGRSPMAADRRHLHHLLLDAGATPSQATALLIAIAALLGTVGIAGIVTQMSAVLLLGGLTIPLLAHTAFAWSCGYRQRRRVPQTALAISSEPAE
ncbi:MAG: undecaprenyl/decaprenyl-phosphate alpha-N-acetylglucosaminyl 1-phosphate transferase [Rhizobiales bacterium]|nr:undecaprenyl/decaprenyl-phosphate alpha-N-acetylglucosaminyl 1-phosphate transferase [Hyphomicrobiales bacterium]